MYIPAAHHATGCSLFQLKMGDLKMTADKNNSDLNPSLDSAEEHEVSLKAKMEIAGKLSGNIAHSFNNKLSSILGYAELALMQTNDPKELKKYLNNIIDACDQAANLTQHLLAFSSKQTLNYTPVDLNNVIHDSIIYLSNSIGTEVDVITDLGYELPQINADSLALDTILSQLCLNASDAMPDGGELRFETQKVDLDETFCRNYSSAVPGEYICLTVSDTGSGIKESDRQRIFEPFFSTKNPARNPGLGLSVVYGLIRQHNGIIELESPDESGTTFKIYFPVSQVQEEAVEQDVTPLVGGTETILIVEDEKDLLQIMNTILRQYGYRVIVAVDGKQALDLYREHSSDINLVISDIIMPEMNGLDLFAKISADDPEINYIFITGYASEFIIRNHAARENTVLLQKPFKMNDLAEKVRELLDN